MRPARSRTRLLLSRASTRHAERWRAGYGPDSSGPVLLVPSTSFPGPSMSRSFQGPRRDAVDCPVGAGAPTARYRLAKSPSAQPAGRASASHSRRPYATEDPGNPDSSASHGSAKVSGYRLAASRHALLPGRTDRDSEQREAGQHEQVRADRLEAAGQRIHLAHRDPSPRAEQRRRGG